MSALTGSQINQSYQGLLKLSDSTTGITSTFQSLQDGLGNDTGLKISTNGLAGANSFNIYKPEAGKYYGSSFGTTAANPSTYPNLLTAQYFFDNGVESYSAITFNCTTLHATDSVEFSLYNSQYDDTYGYMPYQQITSPTTISGTTTTGLKTMYFGSPLTFSGTGPGFYWLVAKHVTSGTFTLRMAASAITPASDYNRILTLQTGFVMNQAGTAAFTPGYNIGTSIVSSNVFNTGTFPSTFTTTELSAITATTSASITPGFILHTIK
jgi:hypothetical protein